MGYRVQENLANFGANVAVGRTAKVTGSLTYDGNLRITTITDAIGQNTSISYELLTDKFKITKIESA